MTDSVLKSASIKRQAQPWLSSATWDTLLILAPAFLSSLIVIAFRDRLENSHDLPLWAWVCFVLMIDVAHVYATLFRTYFDENAFSKNKTLLMVIPAACWIVGCLLHSIDGLLFWAALAYLAVFHFIRQQFGFVALYSRKDPGGFQKFKWLDALIVYMSTIYPVLYWHAHLPRNFNWFVEGDFFESMPSVVADVALVVYAVTALLYVAKELYLLRSTGYFNVPKNLIVTGTALSWWVGIVMLNSDMAFTITNVVTHGIPYMALIWLYHQHKNGTAGNADNQAAGSLESNTKSGKWLTAEKLKLIRDFALTFAPAFFVFLVFLAYLEEGLWAGFIWREHLSFFPSFDKLPVVSDPVFLSILVPLLSLPQSTHYVLDGFIWRVKDRDSAWSA